MGLENQFEQFVKAGLYLRGWSPKTASLYRQAFLCFTRFQESLGDSLESGSVRPDGLTKAYLEAWVVWMRQNGRTPAGCNIYACVFNSFCSWLNEQGLLKEHIKLKKLKSFAPPVTVLTETEIRRLLATKPKRLTYLRTWVLIVLMLDTGCRIDEALNLKASDVDFDNLLLTVLGKGSKVRRLPFSPDLRKHLWPYSQKATGRFLFGTRTGTRITYRNAYRGIKACCKVAGIEGQHIHPHNFRHTFACTFIKRGGSVVMLSRILGHASITTTQTYLRGLQIEDFQEEHARLSPLAQM
jgi:integrase/recombinase XerD